jgi:hypothetical protein
MMTNDDDWTELQALETEENRAGAQVLTGGRGGAMSFFWVFRSILLLFKRDIDPKLGQLDGVLWVWIHMLELRRKTAFPELFVVMAYIGACIRPMLIPTFPYPRPAVMRHRLKLVEVDTALSQLYDQMWRDVFSGAPTRVDPHLVRGEGAIEVLLRCVSATSGHVSPQVLVDGMAYWWQRLEQVQTVLIRKQVIRLQERVETQVERRGSVSSVTSDAPPRPEWSLEQCLACLHLHEE